MAKMPVGMQLWSVREELKADAEGTLRQLKEMGYDFVELVGSMGFESFEHAMALCQKVGIPALSAHVDRSKLAEDESIIKALADGGCQYIGFGFGPAQHVGGPEHDATYEQVTKLAKRCKEHGIQVVYHNHDWEFIVRDGEYLLDKFYREYPADLLQAEIDTGWAKVAGADPVVYLQKYAGRLPLVHLKDYSGIRFISYDENYKLIETYDPERKFDLRPLGYGEQNMPDLLDTCQKAGAKAVIVEQDRASLGKTPMECAKMSIDYLKTLL